MPARTVASLAAAALGLLTVGCGSGSEQSSRSIGRAEAALVTLRLSDVPKGFRIGDDGGCGGSGVEGASERLAAFVLEERPSGCIRELNFAYPSQSGVPPLVQSEALVFDDAEVCGARRARMRPSSGCRAVTR